MITHQKLVEIVEEALEVPSGTISNQENNNWAEKWDSLGHLSILIKLDKYLDGQAANISELSNAFTIDAISDVLRANGLLKT
jgi:acyl carrier protein